MKKLFKKLKWFSLTLPLIFFSFIVYENPFGYDLHFAFIPANSSHTMICFHGMGGDYRIAYVIKNVTQINENLVSFNFPDHDFHSDDYDPLKTSFGTIHEVLPAIFILKKIIVDLEIKEVNLYGFSAGGGAIINTLSVLNTNKYDSYLQKLHVTEKDKKEILSVVQKGWILLDAPLKSIDEIMDFRGRSSELQIVGDRYVQNDMEPIHALKYLSGLSLNVILYFQDPDEVLSNRDDHLYIQRLKEVNSSGKTIVVMGNSGGHSLPHILLWKTYQEELTKK